MTPSEIAKAVEVARKVDDYGLMPEWSGVETIARALLALVERCGEYEQALKTIADGAPMPESWGEQPRSIDAYHVAIAKATLTRKAHP